MTNVAVVSNDIYDELHLLEQGMRLLLAEFESKEVDGQAPYSMRGLMITPSDIERTLEETEHRPEDDALAAFRADRLQWEARRDAEEDEGLRDDSPLARMSRELGLSVWERRCVVLCLAAELDIRYESWFGYLNDDVTLRVPTALLALRLLCDSEKERDSARAYLAGYSPLKRFLLRNETALERSSLKMPLRLDPRAVSFLLHTESVDSRIAAAVAKYSEEAAAPGLLFDERLQISLQLAVSQERTGNSGRLPFLQLTGPSGAGKKLHARHVAEAFGQPLLVVSLDKLESDAEKRGEQLRHIVREALISGAMLAMAEGVGGDSLLESYKSGLSAAIAEYAAVSTIPVVFWLARRERRGARLPLPEEASLLSFAITVPDAARRLTLWEMGGSDRDDPALYAQLADKYAFTAGQIEGTRRQAALLASLHGRSGADMNDYAAASRSQVQHRLSELAEKRVPSRTWKDLVLPEEPLALLSEACNRFKFNETVLNRWGFGTKLPYGRGLALLFTGPPGTGKTMAAEVVARELGLELYRVDLSRVVSKYIGETEKNLRELFEEAENSGSILFFDEGDSLFGKRTEVKDSNDRYANMEAAFLLQRIETFDGVTILATNLLQNMDEAFLRRMQVIVKFPFPDSAERERLFRSMLPAEAPLDTDLDFPFLASSVDVAGGHIKNIVLAAAYMAAAEDSAIAMRHMIRASRQEFHKMGKIVVKGLFDPYV
ncbi:AAA family ATPase [Paenibacillus harenae]|uniref:AAA family ATPase n=1 Tax=Paenibacillus harenae TaxID=306543 RepID=UPI0027D802DD|nr:AAA family ATPase [Paenibacillus harenae]